MLENVKVYIAVRIERSMTGTIYVGSHVILGTFVELSAITDSVNV